MNYAQQTIGELVVLRVQETGCTLSEAVDHLMSDEANVPLAEHTFKGKANRGYTYCKSYMKRKNRLTLREALARAIVSQKDWRVSEARSEAWIAETGGGEIVDLVYEEIHKIIKRGDSVPNADNLRQSMTFSEELQRAQEDVWNDKLNHLAKDYYVLVDLIMNGMPPYRIVRDKLGSNLCADYRQMCESLENRGGNCGVDRNEVVDIDGALECGVDLKWTKEKVENRVQLLSVYSETLHLSEAEASDYYADWRKARTQRRNANQYRNREKAMRCGLWRIRNNERHLWERHLGDRLWRELSYLLNEFREYLGRGVYQHVPRRHFSEKSLMEMKSINLPELRDLLKDQIALNRGEAESESEEEAEAESEAEAEAESESEEEDESESEAEAEAVAEMEEESESESEAEAEPPLKKRNIFIQSLLPSSWMIK